MTSAEKVWIERARAGDKAAYGEIVRLHRQAVLNVAYRVCGDPYMAEDAAQETFIRAWQRLDSYCPTAPLRNWLLRIVTNITIDLLRREKRTTGLDDLALPDGRDSPEVMGQRADLTRRVEEEILALPPASRAVLVLRVYEDLSYAEISDVLGIPVGTVMSRLHYARTRLRENLATVEVG